MDYSKDEMMTVAAARLLVLEDSKKFPYGRYLKILQFMFMRIIMK